MQRYTFNIRFCFF